MPCRERLVLAAILRAAFRQHDPGTAAKGRGDDLGEAADRPPGRGRGSARLGSARLENLIDRHSVRLGAWLLRRARGRVVHLWHRRALVLTTCGRRSGLPRTVVVQYFPDGRDMVEVAANSGMPTHPAWYLNLIDDPRATVEVEGRTVPVRAVPMTRDEADVWWPRVLQTAPDYAPVVGNRSWVEAR